MTEPGDIARADLRSYALRRCIRFYSALGFTLLAVAGSAVAGLASQTNGFFAMLVPATGAAILFILAVVEVASAIVIGQIERAIPAGGPETALWRFARGTWPSWIAAAFFLGLAALLGLLSLP